MAGLQVGDMAPDFTLPAHTGEEVTLSKLRGQKVVLFFYPKDQTPGCTQEACSFRDLAAEFAKVGAKVYGISRDSLRSHERFAAKHGLPMPLLSDEDGRVCTAYGVLKDKQMFGKKVFGIERTTVVIDEEGRIAKVYPKVKVDGHAEEVLAFVRQL
ncbi:MAG: thioredoxin-dependent thiol peroxidase [Alicyclobacillus herbarius]|uniref:thioredoxin-dependent thiol peroxidase n=1 Tax=Alicyclobacillus herbarius TaxID=122960 RepID=UPI000426B411|nr:thioredoxin-dependent thiol peroxidase [Alicyclobacillus herbarius]MCL6631570.1 thioredoxin-dependent thiol peroxidase [Alicyclobacillus herbarius]